MKSIHEMQKRLFQINREKKKTTDRQKLESLNREMRGLREAIANKARKGPQC